MVRCKRKSLILSNKKGLALTSPVKSLVAGAGRGEAEEPERSDGNRLYGSIADKKAVGVKVLRRFMTIKKAGIFYEVHPKSWTQPLRCIFYAKRTQNQSSL